MIYLVVGTGRSGTSTVASILHNKLGIHMGTRFAPGDKNNPTGFWEDLDFVDLNKQALSGGITVRAFRNRLDKLVRVKARDHSWGIKDPRIANLLIHYLYVIPNPRIIWARRRERNTTPSLIKRYSTGIRRATKLFRYRYRPIQRLFEAGTHDVLPIDFNTRINDEQIVGAILNRWSVL